MPFENEQQPDLENIITGNVELVSLQEGDAKISFSISKVKDKDGEEIFVSRLKEMSQKSLFNNGNLPNLSLSATQRERLSYCLDQLDMPLASAVQFALNNPDTTLKQIRKSKIKLLIAVQGVPLSGKTSTLAALVNLHKVSALSMEVFSKQHLPGYTAGMSWIGRPPTREEFEREKERTIRDSKLLPELNRPKIVRPLLDNIANICESGAPNSTLFIDTTGYDPASRQPDIFDLVASESFDAVWQLPDTVFDSDTMWKFVENFPNQEFKDFISQKQKRVNALRDQVIKILRAN